jgi:hypothetical protein
MRVQFAVTHPGRLAQRESSRPTPGRSLVRSQHRPRTITGRWQSGRLHLAVNQVLRTRWFKSITAHVNQWQQEIPNRYDVILARLRVAWPRWRFLRKHAKGAPR